MYRNATEDEINWSITATAGKLGALESYVLCNKKPT